MASNSSHIGIAMATGNGGGGSGTHMADLAFYGGGYGVQFNNQQYAMKGLSCFGTTVCIQLQHYFALTMQAMHFENCNIGVQYAADDSGGLSIIDSTAIDTNTVVSYGNATLLLENIDVQGGNATLVIGGNTVVNGGLVGKTFVWGHVYNSPTSGLSVDDGVFLPYTQRSPALITSSGNYYIKPQPQYTQYGAGAFVSVKNQGAKGTGRVSCLKDVAMY